MVLRLATNVHAKIDGKKRVVVERGTAQTPVLAAAITNPAAWVDDGQPEPEPEPAGGVTVEAFLETVAANHEPGNDEPEPDEPEPAGGPVDLSGLKIAELREIADARGIDHDGMSKPALRAILQGDGD